MTGSLDRAFGYQGDPMHLPVASVTAAVPFYERVLGFRVIARSETPHPTAVLARDAVQIGLTENGGDPTQDGCAFHVTGVQALFDEFQRNGLGKPQTEIGTENRYGAAWKVFFVVAPDGLWFWFGERQAA